MTIGKPIKQLLEALRFGDGREEQIDHAAILDDLHAEQLARAWFQGYWTAIEHGSRLEQD
jgi:hypothetical protein